MESVPECAFVLCVRAKLGQQGKNAQERQHYLLPSLSAAQTCDTKNEKCRGTILNEKNDGVGKSHEKPQLKNAPGKNMYVCTKTGK